MFACFWIYSDIVPSGREAFFGQYKGFSGRIILSINASKIEFFWGSSSIGSTVILSSTWYCVIYNSDGYAYLTKFGDPFNSTPEISRTPQSDVEDTLNILGSYNIVGGGSTPAAAYFDGKIDGIRVYDRILTSDEMTALNNE